VQKGVLWFLLTFGFVAKADLDGDLPVDDASLVEIPAYRLHLEPIEVVQCFGRFLNGIGNCGVGSIRRSAYDFGDVINIIDHYFLLVFGPGPVPAEGLVVATLRGGAAAVYSFSWRPRRTRPRRKPRADATAKRYRLAGGATSRRVARSCPHRRCAKSRSRRRISIRPRRAVRPRMLRSRWRLLLVPDRVRGRPSYRAQ